MTTFEDYYEMLGVSPTATSEEVKRAFLDKSYILHPDRLAGAPESARVKAEAELKKINVAYDTLKDRRLRSDYDAKWHLLKQKPKPSADPSLLRFTNVKPHEVQKGTFVIRNLGGPYSKINISNPDSWVRVAKWSSVTSSDELPLRVEIEAEASEWGKSYLDTVSVRLDEEETRITVQLQTAAQPAAKTSTDSSSQTVTAAPAVKRTVTKSLFSWMKLLLGVSLLVSGAVTVFLGILAFTHRFPPLVGALSFIAAVVLCVVLAKITRSEKYRWRQPGFGLVTACTVGVILVLAFSGVQPFGGLKDAAFRGVASVFKSVFNP